MIDIKLASPGDFPTIQHLAHCIWPETFGKILSNEQISYMLEQMYSLNSLEDQFQKGHQFLLVLDTNVPIGFAGFEVNHKNTSITKIHKIYLLQSSQGSGLGKKLMDHIGQIAINKQNQKLTLNVNRFNPAIKFYKKIGFTTIKSEDIDIGNGFLMEDFVMEKTL